MDYTQYALESLLMESSSWRKETLHQMVAESQFVLQSLEERAIGSYVQEKVMSNASEQILSRLNQFLDQIISAFRKKQVVFYERYTDWIKEREAIIKEKAKESSLTLAPYYDVDRNKDLTKVKSSITNALRYPFTEGDVSFASEILKSVKTAADLTEQTGKLSAILKNRFRFGVEEEDNSKIKKRTLEGQELVNVIGKMIPYVTTDYKRIANSLTGLKASWANDAKKFREAVGESSRILTKDSVLLIEQCTLSETDLCWLEGFALLPETLLEGDTAPNNGEKKNESLTSVQNNIKEQQKEAEKRGEKPAPRGSGNRYQMVDRFTRLMFSSYLTAAEEAYILYIRAICQVLGESPKKEK